MPRSQKQYEEIREQKRQLIMDTALELFAENGFHATPMSQVAKKAGVSKGLAYNYFESKQDILDEIIKTGFDSIYSHFDLNHDGVLTRDEFEHFIRNSFKAIGQNRKFWKLYPAIIMQSDIAESMMGKYGDRSEMIMSMLNQFKRKGIILLAFLTVFVSEFVSANDNNADWNDATLNTVANARFLSPLEKEIFLEVNNKKIESNPSKSTPESRKKRDLQFKRNQ